MRFTSFSIVSCLCLTSHTLTQSGTVIRLASATGQLAGEFSHVTSVRELADGQLLLTDGRDGRIAVGNFTTGSVSTVGRTGHGPKEYEGTTLIFALGGDSSVMVDLGRRWILLSGMEVVGVLAPELPVAREARGFLHGADTLRHVLVYRILPSTHGRTDARDSVRALLLDRTSARADTIAILRAVPSETRTYSQNGGSMTVRVFAPFATGETGLLFPDGWFAVARLDPYRVEWRSHEGRWIRPAALPFERRNLKDAEQQAYRTANTPRNSRPPLFDFEAFPKWLPPFEYRAPADPALLGTPNGSLVIRRTVAPSDLENRYDIVDRRGILTNRLIMPKRERVVGFGRVSVYTVVTGDDDIERVRRYEWPPR